MNARFKATLALVLFTATGCATPQSRIARHQETFDSFPPDVQKKIQEGDVEAGFTPDMVLLALGKPDRVYNEQSQGGPLRVWAYVAIRPNVENPLFVMGTNPAYYDYSADQLNNDTYEKTRVLFRDDLVVAVEHPEPYPGW